MKLVDGALAIVMVLVLAACAQTTTTTAGGGSSAPGTGVTSCRLPDRGAFGAGFLDTRTSRIEIDVAGAQPGRYYDWPLRRWLPEDRNGVSPDGTHYAYGGGTSDFTGVLHIVDVATGADDIYPLPSPLTVGLGAPTVLGYTATSIYIGQPGEGSMAALWIFDLSTHRTAFVPIEGFGAVDGTTVWRSTFDPTDQTPLSWPGVPRANQVERIDLITGTHELWLRRPGHEVGAFMVDVHHNPVVMDYIDKQTVELLLLEGPSNPKVVFKGSFDTWLGYVAGTSADSHGVWFGGDKGVYLYSAAGVLTRVTAEPATPAGDCRDQS